MKQHVTGVVAGLLLGAASASAAGEPVSLSYVFENRLEAETPALHVRLAFSGDPSGATRLVMSESWGGQQNFARAVKNLACVSSPCAVAPGEAPHVFIVTAGPGAPVEIAYDLVQDWQGPLVRETYYRAVVNPDYAFFIGHAGLLVPEAASERPVALSLSWRNFPFYAGLLTSFGTGETVRADAADAGEILSALYFAGDARVSLQAGAQGAIATAIRGGWAFPDQDFEKLAAAVLGTAQAFWGDAAADYFVFTLLPTGDACCNYGGTRLTQSFGLFVSPEMESLEPLHSLVMHEVLHTWIGGRMAVVQPEEEMYWFSEGFTNYYTRLLNLRAGLITLAEYAEDYNQALEAYYLSPARNRTAADVRADFWRDMETQQLPYRQGDILAHNWNAELPGAKLDSVVKDILQRSDGRAWNAETLHEVFAERLPGGILGDVERHLQQGETIAPRADALGPCYALGVEEKHAFDLGFEQKPAKEEGVHFIVGGVREGGPAHAAGLRNGQKVVGYSIYSGDVSKAVKIQVREGKNVRDIDYYPRGDAAPVPQYRRDEAAFAADPAACFDWFGVE